MLRFSRRIIHFSNEIAENKSMPEFSLLFDRNFSLGIRIFCTLDQPLIRQAHPLQALCDRVLRHLNIDYISFILVSIEEWEALIYSSKGVKTMIPFAAEPYENRCFNIIKLHFESRKASHTIFFSDHTSLKQTYTNTLWFKIKLEKVQTENFN